MRHHLIDRSELEEVDDTWHGGAVFPMRNAISAIKAEPMRYLSLQEARCCAACAKAVGDESGSGHGSS